uniref:C2 domain-containing protein n=1 Tax=Aureoumbra lagunensis TaxID=44058 RepID=A0A7S3NI83_9STRA
MSHQQEIFVQVHDCSNLPLAIDKTAKSMYVLTASAKIIVKDEKNDKRTFTSKEVYSGPRLKNHLTEGANFRSYVAGEKGNLLQVTVPSNGADEVKVKLSIYERLTTDIVQTYTLGSVTTKEIGKNEEEAKLQTLALNDKGGEIRVKIWANPTPKKAFEKFDWIFTRKTFLFSLCSLFTFVKIVSGSFRLAIYSILPQLCLWFIFDLAIIIAILLTNILALAVPGLGLSLSAARIGISFDKKGCLLINIGVDDFALANDKGYFFENFVFAKNVKLVLRLDVVDIIRNMYTLFFVLKPREEKFKLLQVQGIDLSPKDQYMYKKASSDPYFMLFVAPSGTISSNGEDIDTSNVDPAAFDLICRSKFQKENLNPEFEEMALDFSNLPSKDDDDVIIFLYDYDWTQQSDLIGIARVSTLKEFRTQAWTEKSVTIYKKGKPGGQVLLTTSTEMTPATKKFWSAFPTENELLRIRRRGSLAPRIATIGLDLQINDPTIAFDIAEETCEFNVNNFVRRLAASKLGGPSKVPNTLKVEILDSFGPKMIKKVVVCLRGKKHDISSPFDVSSPILFDCCDPSAVIELKAYDHRNRFVGSWITTLKMLLLAPTNVFGKNIKSSSKGIVSMEAQLRQKACSIATDSYLKLKLSWTLQPSGKTYKDILRESNLKALEQLQQNSAETNLKLGNLSILTHMLSDFPVLFDIHAFELNRVNFYLKALFAGYETANEHDKVRPFFNLFIQFFFFLAAHLY